MPPMIDVAGNKIYPEDGLTVVFQYILPNFNFYSKIKLTSHFINMCFQLKKNMKWATDSIFMEREREKER